MNNQKKALYITLFIITGFILTLPFTCVSAENNPEKHLNINIDYLGSKLKDLPKSMYSCGPMKILPGKTFCKRVLPGKAFGLPSTKTELLYNKNNNLYLIFVELLAVDVMVAAHRLKKTYGNPDGSRFTDIWSLEEMSIVAKIDRHTLYGNITVQKH